MNGTILAVIAVVILYLALRRLGGSLVSVETVTTLLQQNPRIIDVRTAGEYEAGHLPGVINIPIADLAQKISLHAPDKNHPVLLHCASGARSAMGKKTLEHLGYASVHNLGSFTRARTLLSS